MSKDIKANISPSVAAIGQTVDRAAPHRRQFSTAVASPVRRRGASVSAATLSPSVKQHFRERKRASGGSRKCCLKVQNQSSEILDLGSDQSEAVSSVPDFSSEPSSVESSEDKVDDVTDRLSPAAASGKYFSVVETTESPSGSIKLKLNRVTKRGHRAATAGGNGAALSVPRFSRSKTKDLGMPLQELLQIMAAASPPPKVRRAPKTSYVLL